MKSLIGAPCQPRQRWLEQGAADYALDARRRNDTMSTMTQTLHTRPSTPDLPPLQAGDVLSRAEFERRWDRHPEIKKAELIDGMVYLEMTVSHKHAQAHGRLMTILGGYATRMKNVEVLVDATVRLGADDLQPDVTVRKVEGGGSQISSDDCVEGPPELCVEVAVSSASYDLHQKKESYRRGRVPEYLVWQVFEQRIDWWALDGDDYVALEADGDGIVESKVFPGLRLDVAAMLAGDMGRALDAPSSQPTGFPPAG